MKSRAMIDQILKLTARGVPLRKIARTLDISRNTVRRYLREHASRDAQTASAATDEGGAAAPLSPSPAARVNSVPSWATALPWEKICHERRCGVSLKQLFSEHEPAISYSRFCRVLAREIRPAVETAPRLVHVVGERTQIDFADGLPLTDPKTGVTRKTHLFCAVLPFSSYIYAEFTFDQKLPTFIRAHENMWAAFGGVTPYVVIDNLKAGVTRAHRYDPDTNPTYCDYGLHAGFAVLPARPATPRDKAAIEATIGVLQRTFYQKYRDTVFYDLRDMNTTLWREVRALSAQPMREKGVSRCEIFETVEKKTLLALPREPYEIVEWKRAKVHPDCCVQIHHNFYSVPYRYVGSEVRVKVSSRLISVFSQDTERLACHARASGRGVVTMEDAHLPAQRLAESSFDIRKAKALAASIGPSTREVVERQLSGDRPLRYLRRVQGILRLLNAKGVTREGLEYAAGQALTFQRFHLSYIKKCAEHHAAVGGRVRIVDAPRRIPSTLNLHGE